MALDVDVLLTVTDMEDDGRYATNDVETGIDGAIPDRPNQTTVNQCHVCISLLNCRSSARHGRAAVSDEVKSCGVLKVDVV